MHKAKIHHRLAELFSLYRPLRRSKENLKKMCSGRKKITEKKIADENQFILSGLSENEKIVF